MWVLFIEWLSERRLLWRTNTVVLGLIISLGSATASEPKGASNRHWAFTAPAKTATPRVDQNDSAKSAIDQFVYARLQKEGLEPSPEAERTTLVRRLSLDLTGLPPTPAE